MSRTQAAPSQVHQRTQQPPPANGSGPSDADKNAALLNEILGKMTEYTPLAEAAPIKLSVSMVKQYLCVPTKSGKMPGDADVIKFMTMCKQRALNPWAGDCYLLGYDSQDGPKFSIVVAIQALFKRAEINAAFDGIESGVVVLRGDNEVIERQGDLTLPGETLMGGWARVFRKDRSRPFYQRLKIATFRKGTPIWKNDPEGMISKCFDDETEVLTDEGFQPFGFVTGRIMQVSDSGLEPTDAIPFSQAYSGEMVRCNGNALNFCVTPNHDMIVSGGRRIEARSVYEGCTSSRGISMPLAIEQGRTREDGPFTDAQIMLAAAFICDGYYHYGKMEIHVSKQRNIRLLHSIGLYRSSGIRRAAGASTEASSGRVITTRTDKTSFTYESGSDGGVTASGRKELSRDAILQMSRRQARLLVDTMLQFDGATNPTSRRFYSSYPAIIGMFELAASIGGYSVSRRRERQSDIGGPNWYVTVSTKDEGRTFKPSQSQARCLGGMRIVTNASGFVWCCTVPSGIIIVRRRGLSMLCGNCAESGALRQAFPSEVGGLYLHEELMDISRAVDDEKRKQEAVSAAQALKDRMLPPKPPAEEIVGKAAGLPSQEEHVAEAAQDRQESPGEHDQTEAAGGREPGDDEGEPNPGAEAAVESPASQPVMFGGK